MPYFRLEINFRLSFLVKIIDSYQCWVAILKVVKVQNPAYIAIKREVFRVYPVKIFKFLPQVQGMYYFVTGLSV